MWDVAGWAIVLRHHRRPALPRRHRPGAVLRGQAGHQPDRRGQDLGRRAGHLGRDRARHARRLDRLPPQGHLAARLRRRGRARRRARAGHRPVGQLVQQRALRRADQPAVGPADALPRRRRRATPSPAAPRPAASTAPTGATVLAQHYQPTFLYEALWDVALALAAALPRPALRLGRGNVMALYVMGYTLGRVWIEALRTDHANHILGLRLNIWTCIIVFVLGAGLVPARTAGSTPSARPTPYTRRAGRATDDRRRPEQEEPADVGSDDGTELTELADRPNPEIHHEHRDVSGGWLRPTVFGMMDGLVSNFALIAGVAGGRARPRHRSSLAGLAGLVGGAFSMATGEYISVQSQNESTHAELAVERHELQVQRRRGAGRTRRRPTSRAASIRDAPRRSPRSSRAIPTRRCSSTPRRSSGVDPTPAAQPVGRGRVVARCRSASARCCRCCRTCSARPRCVISAIVAVLALFVAGALSSRFTSRSWLFAGARQLLLGVRRRGGHVRHRRAVPRRTGRG